MDIFYQIGILIILATVGAYFIRLLKQPLIPAYILSGVIIGPILGLITSHEVITTMSEIGIAFLLFIVGLELNFKKLRDIGAVASVGGLIQIILLFALGFVISSSLGFANMESIYIGLVIAFSSTMIVIKLLLDKKSLNTLHGKIIIGILLMQDVVAILAMSLLASVDSFSILVLLFSALKAAGIILVAVLLGKYIFPYLFKFAAKSMELLFLLSLSVCFLFSLLFASVGFSIAIGAFIAGVSLANLEYNVEIISRVRSLRDFFATLFFVSLGMNLLLDTLPKIILPAIVLTLVVILIKPFVTLFICSFFGYTKRTSFLTSISLAQISEFSLIIVAQGMLLGHLSKEIFSLTIVLAVITIISTSYLIKYDDIIYNWLSKYLNVFDLMSTGEKLQYTPEEIEYNVILVGYDRIGYNVLRSLTHMKKSLLVIDFNPDIIKDLVKRKIPCIYGDIGDSELIERMNLKKVNMIVSTVPRVMENKLIIKKTKQVNHKAIIFVTANDVEEALELYRTGADYVILPHFLGGERVSTILQSTADDLKQIIKNKYDHMEELKKRIELGHKHPPKNGS
jgi:Kef-type K+ transport system membrane component KefB